MTEGICNGMHAKDKSTIGRVFMYVILCLMIKTMHYTVYIYGIRIFNYMHMHATYYRSNSLVDIYNYIAFVA